MCSYSNLQQPWIPHTLKFAIILILIFRQPYLTIGKCTSDVDCSSLIGNDKKCYAEADGGPKGGKCDCTMPVATAERDCFCQIDGESRVRWMKNQKGECRLVGRERCEKREKEPGEPHLKCWDYHYCKKTGKKKYGVCTRNSAPSFKLSVWIVNLCHYFAGLINFI